MKTLLASRDRVAAAGAAAVAADSQINIAVTNVTTAVTAAVATAGRKRDAVAALATAVGDVAAAPAAFAVTDDQTL